MRAPFAACALPRNKTALPGFMAVLFRKGKCSPFSASARSPPRSEVFLLPVSYRNCPWLAGHFNSIQKPMPRYYFHFRTGSSTFRDEVGEVLVDASTALQHARRIALELARGGESANALIIVAEGDRQLFEVPLSEQGN